MAAGRGAELHVALDELGVVGFLGLEVEESVGKVSAKISDFWGGVRSPGAIVKGSDGMQILTYCPLWMVIRSSLKSPSAEPSDVPMGLRGVEERPVRLPLYSTLRFLTCKSLITILSNLKNLKDGYQYKRLANE